METSELLKECEEIAELLVIGSYTEKMETLRNQAYTMAKLITKLADKMRESEEREKKFIRDIEFVKRWTRRVHEKETTLEEFYGVLRYDDTFNPEPPKE